MLNEPKLLTWEVDCMVSGDFLNYLYVSMVANDPQGRWHDLCRGPPNIVFY